MLDIVRRRERKVTYNDAVFNRTRHSCADEDTSQELHDSGGYTCLEEGERPRSDGCRERLRSMVSWREKVVGRLEKLTLATSLAPRRHSYKR